MKYKILLFLLMYLNCVTGQNIQRINIGQNTNTTQTLQLSSIAESIKYIPLETTDECLLHSDILQIELDGEMIYLCDGYFIFKFNLEGKFLKKIGNKGQGPGEYGSLIVDFLLDTQEKTVTVFDRARRKFIVYDTEGRFIREYNSDFEGVGPMAFLNKDNYIAYISTFIYERSNNWYDLALMDKKGKVVSKYAFSNENNRRYGLSIYPGVMYFYQGKLMFRNPYEEIIYQLDEKKKNPVYVFDLGRYKDAKDESDFQVRIGKNGKAESITSNPLSKEKLSIYRLCETSEFLFITYVKDDKTLMGVFDKQKKQFYNLGVKNEFGIIEDFEKGLLFWPRLGIKGNMMIGYRQAYEMKSLDSKVVASGLRAILNKMDEEDNQVLIFVTLKK